MDCKKINACCFSYQCDELNERGGWEMHEHENNTIRIMTNRCRPFVRDKTVGRSDTDRIGEKRTSGT